MLRERAHRGFEGRGGFDRNHIAALGGKNVLDVHGSPPLTGSLRRPGAAGSTMLDLLSSSVASAQPNRKPWRRESDPLTGPWLSAALSVADVRDRLSIGMHDGERRSTRLAG